MTTALSFCPHCGHPVTDADDVCPQCQTDLRPFRQATTSAEPTDEPLNLSALFANPYKVGMARAKKQAKQSPNKPSWWPWGRHS